MTELDQYHQHEVLDRTHMIMVTIEQFLQDHPWVQANEDISQLISNAADQLAQAYQLTGSR